MENVVNVWRNRKVFLTGHTGFKGGWLALWLASKGAQVRGYSLAPDTEPNLFIAARLEQVMDDVRGDVRNYSELEASMREFAPEVVFHLAAQPLVLRSYQDPLGTYSTNMMGTANVLEAVRKGTSVRAVVCVTTDKCYGDREWVWPYRETDQLGGHDPYSSSKACAEIAAAAYRASYFPPEKIAQHGVALATARAGNVIGGGDWAEFRLVPDLIRGFQSRSAVLIRRPNAIRPWQHVLGPLNGYIMLAERLLAQDRACCSAFNFGPGEDAAWTVGQVANVLARIWGNGASWTQSGEELEHEAHSLRLDSSKARAELGWHPVLGLQTALEWTAEWHLARATGMDMQRKTAEQILQFENLIGNRQAHQTELRSVDEGLHSETPA